MSYTLNFGGVFLSLFAAAAWLLSAFGQVASDKNLWNQHMSINSVFKYLSTHIDILNFWAALLTAFSVACFGLHFANNLSAERREKDRKKTFID